MNDLNQERPFSWAADMSGSLVTFSEGEKISWGIMLRFPIDSAPRMGLDISGIPRNIKRVDVLIMDPQRVLPSELRNIDSVDSPLNLNLLRDLTTSTVGCSFVEKIGRLFNAPRFLDFKRMESLEDIFNSVIDSKSRPNFKNVLEKSESDSILVVHGHGGG